MPDTGTTNWPANTDDLNLPADMTIAPTSAGDGHYTFKQWLERATGMLRAIATDLITGMTHNLPMGGFKITGLGTPSASTDAATKAYVDATAQGLSIKPSVKGASTTNHSISAFSGSTIDGGSVSLSNGDRILLKDQSTGSENGLWVFNGAGSALTRPSDFAHGAQEAGSFVFVESGTANGGAGYVLASTSIVVDTTAQTWTQFSGAGEITAGTGMTKSGNTLNVVANADNSITANADDIQVAALGITTAKIAANAVTSAKVDSSVEILSHKDAASGYMGVDAAGNGNSPPKAHGLQSSRHNDLWLPASVIATTYPFWMGGAYNNAMLSTGRSTLNRIRVPANKTISYISFRSGATALATGTHQWFFLADGTTRAPLAATGDDVATAWAATSEKKLAICRMVTDAAITSGSNVLTSATANFTAGDVGKDVMVVGAGAAGVVLGNSGARVTIASVTNSTTAVLSANAGTTIASGGTAYIQTPYAAGSSEIDLFVGIVVAASTVPTLSSITISDSSLTGRAPVVSGNAQSSLTDPSTAPGTWNTPNGATALAYAELS